MSERLRLYYPVKPYILFQKFGANQACVKDFGLPTQKVIGENYLGVCPVGYERLYPKFGMKGHNGLDLQAGEQYVYSPIKGTVVEAQKVPARGLGIGVQTDEKVNLDTWGDHFAKLRHWHLKQLFVDVGDKVEIGTPLGVTDSTGYSSGNHLHFELQPMSKDAGGHPYLSFNANGIGAAVDPEPFFCGEYALDFAVIPLQMQLIILLKKLIYQLNKGR